MKKQYKLRNGDKLTRIDCEQIGDGGDSRLDIIIDTVKKEIFTHEYDDHEDKKQVKLGDNELYVGKAMNDYDSRFPTKWEIKLSCGDDMYLIYHDGTEGVDRVDLVEVDIAKIENIINKYFN